MSGKYKKLAKDFIIVSFGSFGSKILTFLLVPLYTAVLSTSDYGIADLISTTIGLIYPILTLSIAEAVVRFVLQKDGNEKKYFSIALYLWILGAVIMLIVAPTISMVLFEGKYILYVYISYIVYSANSIIGQYARGRDRLLQYSISGIISSVIFLTCNILFLVVFEWGLAGYLLSSILSSVVSVLYLVCRLRLWKEFVLPSSIEKKYVKEMLDYSAPLILNAISWWIVMSSDKYMLLFFESSSSNGIYSVAQKIPSLLVTVTSLFISAWQISSVTDFGSKESEEFFSDVLEKYQSLLFIISTLLIAGEKIIAKIMFSADFYIAWKYMGILLLANVFYAALSFLGTVYTAAKKTKMSLYTTMLGAIINIVLNFILIPNWGIMGACVATTISYYAVVVIRVYDIRRFFDLQFAWGTYSIQYMILLVQGIVLQVEGMISFLISLGLAVIIVIFNRKFLGECIGMVRRMFVK